MIELNCSYEESKKILELGYDFEKVCDRFIEELSRLKKPEYLEQEKFLITVFRSEVNQLMADYLTPIIPKAALEACLPDYLLKKGCNLFYHVRKFMGELYWVNSRDESLTENWFSPYEAFIWCHEHYPEELKAKFNEVMG